MPPAATARFDFTGKSVLVTGASRGIGYGVAEAFARAGADLTVLADDEGLISAQEHPGALGLFTNGAPLLVGNPLEPAEEADVVREPSASGAERLGLPLT